MLRPPTESLDSPRRHCALQSGGGFQVHAAGRPDGRGLLQRPAQCLFFKQLAKGAPECASKQTRKVPSSPNKQQTFSKDWVCFPGTKTYATFRYQRGVYAFQGSREQQPPATTPQHFLSQEALPQHQPSTAPSPKRADQSIQLLFRQWGCNPA